MTAAGIVYKDRLIWRDAFHRWLVRGAYGPERFKTKKAAKAFIDRMGKEGL